MIFFLDTNICIFALKGKFPALISSFTQYSPPQIKVPAIVQAELLHGAERSSHRERALNSVQQFLAPLEIIPFDSACARTYSKTRVLLEKSGEIIGPFDLLIAATALTHSAVLVTHNTREFKRIPELHVADWTVENS